MDITLLVILQTQNMTRNVECTNLNKYNDHVHIYVYIYKYTTLLYQ